MSPASVEIASSRFALAAARGRPGAWSLLVLLFMTDLLNLLCADSGAVSLLEGCGTNSIVPEFTRHYNRFLFRNIAARVYSPGFRNSPTPIAMSITSSEPPFANTYRMSPITTSPVCTFRRR